MTTPALYTGGIMHNRLRPFRHRFTARVASLYVDIDDLPALSRRLWLFSHNRFNVFSVHDRDHGPRDGGPLRPWAEAQLARAGIDLDGGSIRLLCFPRMWGYVFNPLSVWFCYHRDGGLRAVLYAVANTFGDHHTYLIPAGEPAPGEPLRQGCAKRFHVSPFLPLAGHYAFRVHEPGERLRLAIRYAVDGEDTLVATQTGRRRPLTDGALLGVLARTPAMTAKVMAAIHWQALHIWRKGASFHRRPAPPSEPVSVIDPGTPCDEASR
ncbi:hypothetical protein SAMN05216241_102360 [Limimonas halophila]|uniref:DUF1365 domain-containing protein n=1 Tax=Limimonas halophila TaxID=1082479 RepID=A0A1G7NY14_9PROT|nr:DUF1365 domain-containing protein [Limimonas halophila]SDF78922.1 hypothetical protein SAMN05216241_102360 [Limimonas halophila]